MLLGIDIGGTTINLGLVKGTDLIRKVCVPSFKAGATLEETLDYLKSQIADTLVPETRSIGVGVPTLVDSVNGIVYDAFNIPSWTEVHLKGALEERFCLPVSVNNDSNCFALGASALTGNRHKVLVGITLGTGTGMGIVNDGILFTGTNCGAGEIGSLPYRDKDFESFCSKKFFHSHGLSPREAAIRAEIGDRDAVALYEEFGEHLGELLSVVMYTYDPGCIVIGGGLARSFHMFEPRMRKTLSARYIYHRFLEKVEIIAMPDEETALIGASLL